MIVLIFLIGFLTASFAAIPPGAANYMVIKEQIQQQAKSVHKLVLGAGIGELSIAAFALQYAMSFTHFFYQNQWFQISIAMILLSLGIFLVLKPKKKNDKTKKQTISVPIPNILKGFLLAAINPPVLVYWVVVFSALGMHAYELSISSSIELLIMYFIGIFLGKVSVLYGYSYWGSKLSNKRNANNIISRTLGFALLIVGSFQSFQIFI